MTIDKAIFVLHPEHKNLKRGELPSGFRPMPENPRDHRGLVALVILCNLLVLVPLFILMISDINLSERFLEDGRDVTAEVIDCHMVRSTKSYRPEITFSYIVDGTRYVKHKIYFGIDCAPYPSGQTLSGVYLPDEPTEIRLGEQPKTMTQIIVNSLLPFSIIGCGSVFVVTMLAGVLYSIGDALRGTVPKNVAREGRITKIYREKEDLFMVEYRFKPSPKRSIKGRDEARRPDLIGMSLPEVGTPVTVLYTDRNQHRLM